MSRQNRGQYRSRLIYSIATKSVPQAHEDRNVHLLRWLTLQELFGQRGVVCIRFLEPENWIQSKVEETNGSRNCAIRDLGTERDLRSGRRKAELRKPNEQR